MSDHVSDIQLLCIVRIHLTTGESAIKYGQAIRTCVIRGFVFAEQIHTVNMNSLMKPERTAWPRFGGRCPVDTYNLLVVNKAYQTIKYFRGKSNNQCPDALIHCQLNPPLNSFLSLTFVPDPLKLKVLAQSPLL